jgi:hypothetical protein
MTSLGEMGQERVVAWVLPMMGIEASEGPADRRAGTNDRAIDVDGQARQPELRDRVGHQLVVQPAQRGQRRPGERPEPVADGARRRDARQTAEAMHQWIPGQVLQVLGPATADVEQRQDQQTEPGVPVVAAQPPQGPAQPPGQIDPLQIAAQQFQPTVRRELLRDELDRQIALDHPAQARYAQPHQRGLQCEGMNVGPFSLIIRARLRKVSDV